MTEEEWILCASPGRMMGFLGFVTREHFPDYKGCASARKHRLFAAACCRKAWHIVVDGRCRQAVEVAEQYADGNVNHGELEVARRLGQAFRDCAIAPDLYAWSYRFAESARSDAWEAAMIAAEGQMPAESALQAELLRDIYGLLPFRSFALPPEWLTWQSGAIPQLARTTYEERTFPVGTLEPTRLAVLADALEEAGCADVAILNHLRGPVQHVRGCHVIDLILGKS